MAEMSIADIAGNFSAHHTVATVGYFPYIGRIDGSEVAGPAAAGIEFCIGGEQRRVTAYAGVGARFVVVPIATGECGFGMRLAGYAVIECIELTAPLGIGFYDFVFYDFVYHEEQLTSR